MGMYDSIVDNVVCIHCGKPVRVGFQTKSFERKLETYDVPDRIDILMFKGLTAVLTDCIHHCPVCKKTLWADFLILDSLIIKLIMLHDEAHRYTNELVDLQTYFMDFPYTIQIDKEEDYICIENNM
jgi:hypothetical protein